MKQNIESDEAGIVQLAEPLLIKQVDAMIQKSIIRLKEYLQGKNKAPVNDGL